MENQHFSLPGRSKSPRPKTHRERSNSVPIVEALGCSTPEAKLLLAEGKAAVRKRRARSQRNRSANDEKITTFNPRHHLGFLDPPLAAENPEKHSMSPEARNHHARIPSDLTDSSTSTVIPQPCAGESRTDSSSPGPLGDYSANLAQFIKAQLRNIPTYTSNHNPAPLSPRSCPDLSFHARTPPQSPPQGMRHAADVPKTIEIPSIRPPLHSQFSAWSSTDDDTDDDLPPLSDVGLHNRDAISHGSNYRPSVLGYYEISNNSSFLLSSTPSDGEEDPDTAKGIAFPNQSNLPGYSPMESSMPLYDDDYPSSSLSRPQLTSPSAPSSTSSSSSSLSYFDCKRPISFTSEMRNRIIAAVTPPVMHGKTLTAVSPWEGAALANVHDVFVESQHRVHVDGMSFDMQRDFIMPSHVGTPC